LISYSGGFIASYGREDVFVFEQLPSDGEEFNFKCIKKIKFPKSEGSNQEENSAKSSTAAIKSLTLSPREDLLVALTSDLLLYSFAMKKKESSVQKRNETVIKGLEKDIQELKREIRGRDETVQCKEKEITELKRDLRSMEKHSFVLNHKIKLLEDEIQPKENKIAEMKNQILAMEEELTAVVKDQAEFNVQMNEAKSKLANATQEVTFEKRKVIQQISQISRLQKEIQGLQSVLQDPKKLRDAASSLCNKFGVGAAHTTEQDTELSEKTETVRQKDYLEKTVLSLKSQLSQVDQQNKTNSAKMLKENKALLQEISRLKAELKDVKKFKAKLPLKRKASPTTE